MMIKLDFDIVYNDISQYTKCWLCSEKIEPHVIGYDKVNIHTAIICMYCMYGLSFFTLVDGRFGLNAVGFYGNQECQSAFIIHRTKHENNKLKIKFPIDLDEYLRLVSKRMILL